MFAAIMAHSVQGRSRRRFYDSRRVISGNFIVSENNIDYECFNDTLLSLTVYRKPRLPCVKGAVSAAD